MYKFALENKNDDRLTFNEIGGAFTILEISGLSPASATINTSPGAYIDGEFYNGAKVDMRTLEIAFAIEKDAAANRIAVYRVLKSKQWVRAYYTGDYRDVYIDGYIQEIEITHFEIKQIVTVSILCPSPFWRAAQEIVNELSTVIAAFHFPFMSTEAPELLFGYLDPTASVAIENDGDVTTGLTIELYARDSVSNPKIWDYKENTFIGLKFAMLPGDLITITTGAGEKAVRLLRGGVESNIFNALMQGSTWLQLDYGGGVYVYEVGTGSTNAVEVLIKHNNLYEGV